MADLQGFSLAWYASWLMKRVLRRFQHGFLTADMPAYYCMRAVNGDRVSVQSSRREHGGLSFIYDAKLRVLHHTFQIFPGVVPVITFWGPSFPFSFRSSKGITRSISATKSGIIQTF